MEQNGLHIDCATTNHEAIRFGYSGTQLTYITPTSTSTERESVRLGITSPATVCVVAPQRQLAAPGKTNSSRRRDKSHERITTAYFLTTTATSS